MNDPSRTQGGGCALAEKGASTILLRMKKETHVGLPVMSFPDLGSFDIWLNEQLRTSAGPRLRLAKRERTS